MSPARDKLHSLADLLVGERRCCAALGELLERERAAAVQNDLAGLLATLREREDIQARWQRVAAARDRALAGGPSLEERAAADPSLGEALAELRRELRTLRSAQQINARIVRAALGGVDDLLATMRRLMPGGRYDARAIMTDAWPRRPALSRSA